MPLAVTKEDDLYILRSKTGMIFCVVPGPQDGEKDFGLRLSSLAYCLECLSITGSVAMGRDAVTSTIAAASILAGMESMAELYDSPARN